MKKMLLLFLSFALILGLCACSKDIVEIDPEPTAADTAALQSEFEAACACVESAVDVSKMESDTRDEENGMYRYWNGSGEENDAISADFTLEDNTFTIGKTLISELTALGYKLDINTDTAGPNTVLSFSITKDDKFFNLSVDNSTDKPQKLSDMPIMQFSGTSPDDGCLAFTYNGVTCGSTLKEALDALGEPKAGITVSTATGSQIQLSYLSVSEEDDLSTSDSLDVYLKYDKESDSATVTSVNFNRMINNTGEQEASE